METTVERETVTALRDAIKALRRAEKLLEDINRPALAQAAPAFRAMEKLAAEHSSVALDLRIARMRIEVILPSDYDPEKTPVEPVRRLSQQMAARKPSDPDEPDKR